MFVLVLLFFTLSLVEVQGNSFTFVDPHDQTFNGAIYEYYNGFNDNDFSKRSTIEAYPKAPYGLTTAFNTFQYNRNWWFNHLARARSTFKAPESGRYSFHVVCKARCQLDISDRGFDVEVKYILGSKTVGADIPTTDYKSNNGKLEIDLVENTRYHLTVYQRGKKNVNGWIGVGLTYPNGTEEMPMTSAYVNPAHWENYQLRRNRGYTQIVTMDSLTSDANFFIPMEDGKTIQDCTRDQNKMVQLLRENLSYHWRRFMTVYYSFWYKQTESVTYKTTVVNFNIRVYVDKQLVSELGEEFQVAGSGWKQFHIFISTIRYRHLDNFYLRRKQGNDSKPLDKNKMRYQLFREDFYAPTGAAINSTSATFTVHAPLVPGSSTFGSWQSFKLVVWGPNRSPTEHTGTSSSNKVFFFHGLNIFTTYYGHVIYYGTDLSVTSVDGTVLTGEYYPFNAPTDLNTTALNSTSIRVNVGPITENQNGYIVSYSLYYAKVDTNGSTIIGEWNLQTSPTQQIDVGGLEFWTHYAFKVAGATIVGAGPNTTNLEIARTMEDLPTGAPLNIIGYNLTETSIVIKWDEITEAERNGVIRGYKISYKNLRTNAVNEIEVVFDRMVNISGLDWFQEYEVKIRGKTNVGYGIWSNPSITVSTDEWIPQLPPLNVRSGDITGTTIQLLFDNIADPFRNFGFAIASKINVTSVSDIFQQQEFQYGGSDSAIITGLNEYTNYSLSVAVGTRRGFLVFAQPILVRTDFGPPSLPPENIFAQKINSTSLNIRFGLIPPDDRNGIITKYLVNIRQLNVDTNWTTYEVIENDQTKNLDIGGLEKWRDYEYTVAGCTIVCGVESPIAIMRTDQDLPEKPPANTTAGPESSTSIKVRWDVVPEGFRRGIITKYHVMYKDDTIEPPDWKETTITAPTQEVVLPSLKFFTSYSFKIAAETVKGRGNRSIEFSSKTLEDVPVVFPSNMTCLNGSSSTIECDWDQMLEIHGHVNGIIIGYRIYYNVLDCAKAELAVCNENTTFVNEVTVPDLLHTIVNLKNYTEYEIQIELFNSLATGPKSPKIVIYTDEDVPESPPTNVEGFTMSTTSVSIYWDDVPWGTSHGILIGYVCYYRRMNDGPPADELKALMTENRKRKRRSIDIGEMEEESLESNSIETLPPVSRQRRSLPNGGYLYPEEAQYVNATESGMIIENLELYQWYTLRLAAMTSKGPGPTFDLNVSCAQAVPITGPNITLHDKFSFTELTLNWSTLSYADSQGTVFDYNIIYYPIKRHGIDLAPVDQEVTSLWFEFPTQGVELNNLEPFMTYAFQSAAQTFAGPGAFSKPFYAETCRCEKSFKAVYRDHMPYFGIENGKQIGLLKNLVTEATRFCCGNCSNGHGTTRIDWQHPLTSVSELNEATLNDTDFVLPIETDKRNIYYKSKPFVGILESPGVSVFSLKVEYLNLTNNMMLDAVIILWSFVVIVALIVTALGMVMWIVQCHPLQLNRTNREDFPDNFTNGAGAGIWWAFNTVLRVGYGDVVASGKLGRIFSIPIIVVGIAISATLVAGISSMFLAYSVQKVEGSIFAKKVVALNESYDQLVIKRVAGIISETAGNAEELIEVLRSKRVDRLAVDAMYAAYHSKKMSAPDVMFRDIKDSGATQGIVFGGRALRLEKCFRTYFNDKSVELIERMKDIIDADDRNYSNNELLEKRNAMIKYESDIWMLLIKILGGLFLGAFIIGCFYQCKHKRNNKVMAYVVTHKTCNRFFEKDVQRIMKEFEEQFERKINKIEVKHAFEREYLIKNMRQYVEWLTPDQVNKYKF